MLNKVSGVALGEAYLSVLPVTLSFYAIISCCTVFFYIYSGDNSQLSVMEPFKHNNSFKSYHK
jgi:hypothetical protein